MFINMLSSFLCQHILRSSFVQLTKILSSVAADLLTKWRIFPLNVTAAQLSERKEINKYFDRAAFSSEQIIRNQDTDVNGASQWEQKTDAHPPQRALHCPPCSGTKINGGNKLLSPTQWRCSPTPTYLSRLIECRLLITHPGVFWNQTQNAQWAIRLYCGANRS